MRNKVKILMGVALVLTGALLLIVAYVAGWTTSNLVLLAGLLMIIVGIYLHVKLTKLGEKY
jgi:uncharacterized membrane protein HdeD (DUF308 family)